MPQRPLHSPAARLAPALLSAMLCAAPSHASDCALLPMAEQLLIPELRSDTPQYAELDYRKQLLRFVNSYYSQLASDLLRGEGEYLNALHTLMGSSSKTCNLTYQQLLLIEANSSQHFAEALWTLRDSAGSSPTTEAMTQEATTHAAINHDAIIQAK